MEITSYMPREVSSPSIKSLMDNTMLGAEGGLQVCIIVGEL